jgi:hypothetical protein
MFLHDYFHSLRSHLERLEDYGYAETIEINEEIRPDKQAIINVRIILINGSELQIKEYIDGRFGIERVSYAYHYQDGDGNCIFRYDNAAHKPDPGFKEHKHPKGGKPIKAVLPDISELIDEVIEHL